MPGGKEEQHHVGPQQPRRQAVHWQLAHRRLRRPTLATRAEGQFGAIGFTVNDPISLPLLAPVAPRLVLIWRDENCT